MTCEKCWADAFDRAIHNPMKSQAECYAELLQERKDNPCTPQEQAGEYWDKKLKADKRIIKMKRN